MNHLRNLFARVPGSVAMLASCAVLASCQDSVGTDLELEIDAFGFVDGIAFVDLNGNDIQDSDDDPYPGLRLQLRAAGGGGVVRTATTNLVGEFNLDSVPVGSFELVLDPATAPDTVDVSGLSSDQVIVLADSTVSVEIRASFPTYTLAQIRGLEPGIRVRTHGIALNRRRPDGDGVVHVREGDVFLRATSVDRGDISTGDSVRFIGRTARDAGQPILTDVRPFRLVSQAAFVQPIDVLSSQARSAQGGSLDAALVQIRDALVLDTVRVAGQFIVTADDGSGPVDLLLRDFLGFTSTGFKPDSAYLPRATGLLVPTLVAPPAPPATLDPARQVGPAADWRMTPRTTGDVSVTNVPILAPTQSCAAFPEFAFATFGDPGVEARVRTALGVGPVAPVRCSTLTGTVLTTLSVPSLGVTSVAGVQNLVHLRTLILTSNLISDISSLSGATSVVELRLENNFVSNIGAIAELSSLKTLLLAGNLVADLTPLAELAALTVVGLADNAIVDVGPLAGLTSLEELDLSGNQITSVAGIGGLFGLTELSLANNPGLANIQPLINNPGLDAGDAVDLTGTAVTCPDVASLAAKGVTVVSDCP